jgi:hypothetical protein
MALRRSLMLGVALMVVIFRLESQSWAQAAAVNADAAALNEFQTRLKEYVALHGRLEGTLPRLPNDATAAHIAQHQRRLAQLIIMARAGAKPGDVFGPEMPALVRKLLKPAFSGATGRQNRATATDPDDRTPAVPVKVNARYPDQIPLSTMPPEVLQALPDLRASKEHEVKFYFIGRHLILLDVHAHLIVDFIGNAMPPQ